MPKITENFLKNASDEELNKELEWNKIELPKAEVLYAFYMKAFDDWEKEELTKIKPNKAFYLIVKRYIIEELKLDMSEWIHSGMFVEGTLENTIYEAYIKGRKRPWEE